MRYGWNAGHLAFADMQIVGVFEKDGQKLPHSLTGKWDTALEVDSPDGGKQKIWEVNPRPTDNSRSVPNFSGKHWSSLDQDLNRLEHSD